MVHAIDIVGKILIEMMQNNGFKIFKSAQHYTISVNLMCYGGGRKQ